MHRDTKLVSWEQLTVGQRIEGYELKTVSDIKKISIISGVVKEIVSNYVVIETGTNSKHSIEDFVPKMAMFEILLTEEELKQKYARQLKELLQALQNKLYYDEIGYHEMWNSWLRIDPYEMLQELSEHNIHVVGFCSDITPKTSWLTGDALDIGICAEYDNGERFWCHWKSKYLRFLLECYGGEKQ